MSDRPAMVTVGDLIEVAPIATVIDLDEVATLRRRLRVEGDDQSPEAADALDRLVGQYLVAEDDNRRAVETLLESLARPSGRGGAFLVRGVHGCGKSHLLAALALLCEFPGAWNLFAQGHPELARLARAFGAARGLLVVPIDLEHYGADVALETVVFACIERELEARGAPGSVSADAYVTAVAREHIVPHYPEFEAFVASAGSAPWAELVERDPGRAAALARRFVAERRLPITFHRSRSEAVAELQRAMAGAGLSGVVLLIDELGLFLSSKPRAELDADAAFLQFLARRTRSMPLWIVASVQRGLEDVGDIDRRTLRQIQDRFRTDLSLSIAQLRAVIGHRLIARRDPAGYRAMVAEIHGRLAGDGGAPCFSADELAAVYPLHPMTLECLEALAGSFLSKTRSLVSFVQHATAAHLDQPAERLLTLDSVFDHFQADLGQVPEAASHWRAYAFLRDNMTRLVPSGPLGHKLAKALMLIGIAGRRWTAREFAGALIGTDLPAQERTAEAVRDALESLRRRGAHVELTAGAHPGETLYFLDVSSTAPEASRRRLAEIDATVGAKDGRVAEAAIAACVDDQLPLSRFREPGTCVVTWMNTRRAVLVGVRDLTTLRSGEVINLAESLASPDSEEDAYLFVAPPLAGQEEAWRTAISRAAGKTDSRFAPAVLTWLPRPPTAAEGDLLREHAAIKIALSDPALEQSRGQREVREHLLGRQAAMADELRGLVSRLYYEGQVLDAHGEQSGAASGLMPLEGDWRRTLEWIFTSPLSAVFPDFAGIAPRARLGSAGPCRQVIDEFVRSAGARPALGSPLSRHLENYAEPLGIVSYGDASVRLVADPESPLVAHVLARVPLRLEGDGDHAAVSYPRLEHMLAKSSFGIPPDLTQVVVAALLRQGYLVGLDGFLQPVGLDEIALPMHDHLAFVRQAEAIDASHHPALCGLARALFDWSPGTIDLPTQEAVWQRLIDWSQGHQAMASELEARLAAVVAGLGQSAVGWPRSFGALRAANTLAAAVDTRQAAAEGLATIARADTDLASLEWFRRLIRFLRERVDTITAAYAFLTDGDFRLPPRSQLSARRARVLEAVGVGETLIDDEYMAGACEDLLRAYRKDYLAWHDSAHSATTFRPYVEAKQSPPYRALAALDMLPLPEAVGRAEIDVRIDAQLSKHCPGLDLPGALESSPVCPRCRLRLGESLALVPPGDLVSAAENAVRERVCALSDPARRALVERRLADDPDSELADRVHGLLALSRDGDIGEVAAAASEQAVAWLTRALRTSSHRTRRLDDLSAVLRGRQLTRGDIERAFRRWLDGGDDPGDDDYLQIS